MSLQDLRGHTSFVMAAGREPSQRRRGGDRRRQTLEDLGLEIGRQVDRQRGRVTSATMEIVGVAVLPVTERRRVGIQSGSRSVGEAAEAHRASAVAATRTTSRAPATSRSRPPTGVDVAEAVAPYLVRRRSLVDPVPVRREVESADAPSTGFRDRWRRCLGVIAVIAVAHAAAVTVRRRRRDLAMLRVLGLVRPRAPRHGDACRSPRSRSVGAVVGVVLGVGPRAASSGAPWPTASRSRP